MPARRSSVGLAIVDPDVEALGPAMLACTPLMRRFVIGIIQNKFKDASRVYRVAGGSKNDNTSRKGAYQLLRHPKIVKAIQEESGRRLEGLTAFAVLALERNLRGSNAKTRQNAADSILDRVGFPRRTERTLEVDDKRPTNQTSDQLANRVAEKLRSLYNMALPKLPAPTVIEGEYKDVANGDAASRVQDEQLRDAAKVDAPSPVAAARSRKSSRP